MNGCFELFRDPNKRLPFGIRQDGSMPGGNMPWRRKIRVVFLQQSCRHEDYTLENEHGTPKMEDDFPFQLGDF